MINGRNMEPSVAAAPLLCVRLRVREASYVSGKSDLTPGAQITFSDLRSLELRARQPGPMNGPPT